MAEREEKYITLSQFLKWQNLCFSGGQAKMFILENDIYVNGELEKRRGRKLFTGDEVVVEGKTYVVDLCELNN